MSGTCYRRRNDSDRTTRIKRSSHEEELEDENVDGLYDQEDDYQQQEQQEYEEEYETEDTRRRGHEKKMMIFKFHHRHRKHQTSSLASLLVLLIFASLHHSIISPFFNNNKNLSSFKSSLGTTNTNPNFLQVHAQPQQQQPQSLAQQIDWPPQRPHHQEASANGQLLQVFNGNESQAPEMNHFKIMETYGDFLLIGSRNVVYNLSLTSMREVRRIEWAASDDDARLCRMKGKSYEQCQNYIKVLKWIRHENSLFVCGTNAYKPRCRTYFLLEPESNDYKLMNESSGEGYCPYQESQDVTTLYAEGQIYSATTAQFSGFDGLIHRTPIRTEQFNPRQLNSPRFVASFAYREHVYFLFRESAIEHTNCGKRIYSRIGRVCMNDRGGSVGTSRERWTSFAKARLNCSIPGEYPFYFDEIQAASQVISSPIGNFAPNKNSQSVNPEILSAQGDIFYAVFTTPSNSIGGSAVCSYRMSDIMAAFEGPFKGQEDINANWLPIAETRMPNPRPGTCVNDSKLLPEEYINFVRENSLMDDTVDPIWSQPLLTMASINFNFTSITVDPQVEIHSALGAPSMRTDVIFVGTSDGRAFKLINTQHLFPTATSNTNLHQSSSQALAFGPNISSSSQQVNKQLKSNPYSSIAMRQTLPQPQPQASSFFLNPHPNLQQQSTRQFQHQQQHSTSFNEDISRNTVIIEELHLFDSKTPIVSLHIHKFTASSDQQQSSAYGSPLFPHALGQSGNSDRLLVLSGKQLKVIPLARCERALSCGDCLSLYDPYCGWDSHRAACLPMARAMGRVVSNQRDHYGGGGSPQHLPQPVALQSAFNNNGGWFPPNNNLQQQPITTASYQQQVATNYSILAWWQQCPNSIGSPSSDSSSPQPGATMTVGPPFKSLFSSHLQVPSRYDYESGHHLSRTSLLSFTSTLNSNSNSKPIEHQPASECLSFCGSVYSPGSVGGSSLSTGGVIPIAIKSAPGAVDLSASCADYMAASHYIAAAASSVSDRAMAGAPPGAASQQQLQHQHLMTSIPFLATSPGSTSTQLHPGATTLHSSESLYFAVIICALFGIILGLLFGFVLGRNASKKQDSSVCSSTFDENNLYMASTGSHTTANLFATGPNNRYHQNHPLIQHQHQSLINNNNNGGHFRQQNSLNLGPPPGVVGGAVYETCGDNYSSSTTTTTTNTNQQLNPPSGNQFLLTLASNTNNNNSPSQAITRNPSNLSAASSPNAAANANCQLRTGALPAIPSLLDSQPSHQMKLLQHHQQQQQQPLVNNSSTLISQSAQLTPGSVSSKGTTNHQMQQQQQHHHMSISSGSSSTNTSCSTSATAPVIEQQSNQLYLNQQQQQQLLFQAQNNNNSGPNRPTINKNHLQQHQQDSMKCKAQQQQQQQQQQQHHQHQQATFQAQQANKIYL